MSDQERVFLAGEADAWFRRNAAALDDPAHLAADPSLALLDRVELRPASVLEVGCANGWRLAEIQRRTGADCTGIEPSPQALADGLARFPRLRLLPGVAHDLPLAESEQFDLVIVSFVLHWVSREALLAAVAAVDRRVRDGGHLLVADFLPDAPRRNRYHHRPDVELYTYKLDYAAIFRSTALYTTVAAWTFDHRDGRPGLAVPGEDRAVAHLLWKGGQRLYAGAGASAPPAP